MDGTFKCRYCGVRFDDLSLHFPECVKKRAADDLGRLEELERGRPQGPVEDDQARAALAPLREALKAPTIDMPISATAAERAKAAFDRTAYHKAYMREYMRLYRARRVKPAASG